MSISCNREWLAHTRTHSRSFLETCCVFNSLLRRSKSFSITRDTHSRPVLWTCCLFDSFLSRSKSFSITRGTHSRSFLGTCCVFDSSLSKSKLENDLLLFRYESNTQLVPRTGRDWVPRVIKNDLLLLREESNTQHVHRKERQGVCIWFVPE
jgi:hypothetical protein